MNMVKQLFTKLQKAENGESLQDLIEIGVVLFVEVYHAKLELLCGSFVEVSPDLSEK